MQLILHHHLATWMFFPDHWSFVANLRYRFFGEVDPTGLLHRLVSW